MHGDPQAENAPGRMLLPESPPSDANPDQHPPPTAGIETNPFAAAMKLEPHDDAVAPPVPVVVVPPVPVTMVPPVPVVMVPPVPRMPPVPVVPPVCVPPVPGLTPPVPVEPPVRVPPVLVELEPPVLVELSPPFPVPLPVVPETVSPLAQE